MLVLTRRLGEQIVIAGNIRVTVVAVMGQRIRLGITAPPSVAVARPDLLPGGSVGPGAPTAVRNGKGRERGGTSGESAS
jgi:carbon storage regulator